MAKNNEVEATWDIPRSPEDLRRDVAARLAKLASEDLGFDI